MTRAKISEYSATANDNTDVNGINIAENCPPSSMNNMGREIMAALKRFQVGSDGDGVTVGGALVVSGATTANTLSTDLITEKTSAAGVTVDGVLLKDSGVVVADGSASAPTVTNTGDTNTGLYFPAADEVAVAAGGSVAAAFNSHQFMGMRNRIINGDMRIDQRNAGAAVTVDGAALYTLDRWRAQDITDGAFTIQQVTDAPVGFVNSLKFTTTTADASLSATQYTRVLQSIEGTNVSDLAWGTANAKTITLSFVVRSSLTGTFGGSVTNSAQNRSYPFTYSIAVADTWEYKTVTIPGDTTGTWLTTTGAGVRVVFGLGVGSTFSGTAGAWAGSELYAPTGATSVIGTLNATWYITGVQLEVGSVATPFERRPYGTELALCQRYYFRLTAISGSNFGVSFNNSTTSAGGLVHFPVTMRDAPTALEQSGTASDYRIRITGSSIVCSSVPVFSETNLQVARVNFTVSSGLTAGQAGLLSAASATTAHLAWSAEL